MSESTAPIKDSGGGDSTIPAVKPKVSESENHPPNKRQQQHGYRGQRRGYNNANYNYYQRPRGKGQRHFSHGGEDYGMGEGTQQHGRRRHSTDGKNTKKKNEQAGAASVASNANKGPRVSGSRYRNSLSESAQNGSGDFDYYTDDFELEEPFSESDEEDQEARRKRQAKPQLLLPMPRRRIRTLSGTIPAVGYAPVWGGPTMCLGCLEFFDLPSQTSAYVEHLLEKHKIVIADIELIVDLKRYIENWRHRFAQESIEKFFPAATPNDGNPLKGKVDQYYLMSEAVPEDLQIRERLALRRLEEVLQCQQREREDRTFRRQCLFCRYRSTGNRAKLIHHLYTVHHLNLGSPDNLVFINEYIDVLQGKMKNNECIYCEQTFPDHQTLADHMKKRGHREVNPKNHYYDKFYVINYLELGKRWLEVLAEDFEDNTPTFIDSEEEEEEESWNEWQEDVGEENEINALCLFCEDAFSESGKLLEHMKEKHKYDLKGIITSEALDFYDAVKLVNFIRKQSYNLVCYVCDKADLRPRTALTEHLETDGHLSTKLDKAKWNLDEYLIPTYDNDHLLLFLGEIVEDHQEDEEVFETWPKVDAKEPEKSSIHVIPEDPPELEETVLKDPELRDQLK